jgi:hypothetical protein
VHGLIAAKCVNDAIAVLLAMAAAAAADTTATGAAKKVSANNDSDSSDADQDDAPSPLQPLATCYEAVIVAAAKLKQVRLSYTTTLVQQCMIAIHCVISLRM